MPPPEADGAIDDSVGAAQPGQGKAGRAGLSLDLSPNVVLLVDAEGRVVRAGGRCQALLDLPESDLEGRLLRELVLTRDRALLPERIEELIGWEDRLRHPLEVHLRYGKGKGDEADSGQFAGAVGEQEARWRLFSISACDHRRTPGVEAIVLSLQPIGQPGSWDVSRQLLLEAIEAANSCIVIADQRQPDQPLAYINEGFRRLTGYTDAEVIGKNCRFLQRRPDGSMDRDQPGLDRIREAINRGEFVNATVRNYTKSGQLFFNDLYLTPVRQDGELVAYVGVQNDVTDRVTSARQLAQREETISSFFDAAPMKMGVVELSDRDEDRTQPAAWKRAAHVMANQRAALFFGRKQEELPGVRLDELGLGEELLEKIAAAFAEAMASQTTQQFTCSARPATEGTHRQLRVVVNSVRPGDHEPPRCSYIAEDVTEATNAEQRRRLLEAAVENVNESILITTPELDEPGPRIVYVNQAFEHVTGYTSDEVLGRTPRILQGELTDRATLDRLRDQLGKGETFSGETINYRKDGTPYHVAWSIAPLYDETGRITHWVSGQRDTTRRRQLERQVLDVQRREQERIARDLHDTVAQQLNTLTLYLGTVRQELVAAGVANNEQISLLREAIDQARQAGEQARSISHSLVPVDLGDQGLTAALERLCSRAELAYGVSCEFQHDPEIVVTDRDRATHIYHIASEAVGNALRHGQPSRVVIALTTEPSPSATLALSVRDDGVGIQTEAGDDIRSSGDGLGLHTMQYRAQLLGGSLTLRRGDGPPDRPGTLVLATFPREG